MSTRCKFPFIFPILLLVSFSITAAVPPPVGISYSQYCKGTVTESTLLPDPNPSLYPRTLALRHAYVDYRGNDTKGDLEIPRSLFFSARRAYRTQNNAVFKIEAVLSLSGVRGQDHLRGNRTRRGLRLIHYRPPRIPVSLGDTWNSATFTLNGFWDWSNGKLCMIGSGSKQSRTDHVVLKLDYLNSSSIFNSFVNGTFEIFNVNADGINNRLLTILGVNLRKYRYELIDKEIANKGFDSLDDTTDVSLGVEDLGQRLCLFIRRSGSVELTYENDCESVNCKFLGRGNNIYTPSTLSFNEIECSDDGRVRFLLDFGDFGHNGHQLPFEPNMSLISEGKWDAKKKRLNMVGCRIFRDWYEDFVGECLIRLSFRFPARWTLKERSSAVGILWSSRSLNESGYFGRVALASKRNTNPMAVHLRYEYTEIENAKRSCANKTMHNGIGAEFPDGLSSDLRFDIVGGNRNVKNLWGYSSPLYVEDRRYQASVFDLEVKSPRQMKQNYTGALNVSYVLTLSSPYNFKLSSEYLLIKSFEISAEGLYDSKSGHVCMVGCMHVIESSNVKPPHYSSLDCEILLNIQYLPLHSKNGAIAKGTIKSIREKSDSLYFEPFEFFSRSIYSGQAVESLWRMDLEITMLLVSNTLSCFFVCLQLLHVNRHPDVLPFISTMMLAMLTLAHMVPLLLNFEAFLVRRNGMDSYFHSDGWLEMSEVLVRIITMIAFLLEFRLLQLTWSAKSGNESQKNLWMSDKKVLYVSLPISMGGGLIAWFVHASKQSNLRPSLRIHQLGYKQESLWGDLKSYGGLILDGFLLPQILFNLFCDAKEKALAPSFYAGITIVRLMPHAYDFYRSHSSTFSLNYIYANPRLDYYSTTWDIIISVGGLLFVFLIYLQQRYGGKCFLPKRWRTSTYEKLPVVSAE
ncbi:uncharacterized protein [Primulina huaijiensis]|uniref:uncharacterized protein n=1 Tax=Primulina huaijiensis TaxID=1492673 RepID=UPI003CC78AC2